ncbi:TonB-dependent receptor [Sphingopyxis sp. 22461]|uniref:TonB-dependent receptor n=1 Tax=Sphingopyxis sp. 22461 TaxID=3453923 RepID=UPI003F840097
MSYKLKIRGSVIALAVVQCIPGGAALAQEGVAPVADEQVAVASDEIIVTAQRREQSLQSVPVTVQAFTNEMIQARGLEQIGDLATVTPGLNIAQSSSGALQPYLRGVGTGANAVGSEGSIAVYIDGVYFSRPNAGAFSLNNIERVEVLKGPQGTLFGRNSSGGVIQLITQDPVYEPVLRGNIGYGNYDTFTGAIYASVGLSDKIALDVAASGRSQRDGFGRNITTGRKTSYTDNYNFKSKLMFEPSETTKIVLSGLYSWSEVPGLGNQYPGTTQGYPTRDPLTTGRTLVPAYGFYDQRGDVDALNRIKMYSLSGRIEQEFGFANFVSITAYQNTKEFYQGEGDYTEVSFSAPTLRAHIDQFTQEFQLSSLSSSPVEWIAGLFYYNNLSVYDRGDFTGYGDGGVFDFDTYGRQRSKSYAAFGQATYPITSKLGVTVGLRYTKEKTDASGRGDFRLAASDPLCQAVGGLANGDRCALFPQSDQAGKKVSKLTWKGGLNFQATSDILLYGSVSRSFKSGQYDILFPTPNQTGTDPEVLTAYEIGAKTDLFDRRLRLNLAAFRYDIDNPQVQLIQSGAIILSNADSERIWGAEFDGNLRVATGLNLRFSGTWLDAKYLRYDDAPYAPPLFGPVFGAGASQLIDAAGNRPQLTSKFSYGIGADYTVDTSAGELQATVDYSHRSSFFWDQANGPELTQRGYGLLDARLRFAPTPRYSLSVWGKNLTNEHYAAFATSLSGPTGFPYIAGSPRTYGVSLNFEF